MGGQHWLYDTMGQMLRLVDDKKPHVMICYNTDMRATIALKESRGCRVFTVESDKIAYILQSVVKIPGMSPVSKSLVKEHTTQFPKRVYFPARLAPDACLPIGSKRLVTKGKTQTKEVLSLARGVRYGVLPLGVDIDTVNETTPLAAIMLARSPHTFVTVAGELPEHFSRLYTCNIV